MFLRSTILSGWPVYIGVMIMYIECDLGFFPPGTLSRANPVCTWLYHLIPDIFREFGKMPETSEFENNFMRDDRSVLSNGQ